MCRGASLAGWHQPLQPCLLMRNLDAFVLRSLPQLFTGAKQRFLDALLSAARVELYLPRVSGQGGCVWGRCSSAEG